MAEVICGIDVSSKTLQVCVGASGAEAEFASSPSGVLELAEFCFQHGVTLAVMEATGGYERQVHVLLSAAGVACALVNPFQVRRFAQGMGVLEKTDRLDAGVIATFAAARGVRGQLPRSEAAQTLREQVRRLQQATGLCTVQKNQRRLVTDSLVLAQIDELLALLASQIRALEQSIAAQIEHDPLWAVLNKALRGIKGVASRTVARIVADLPEIGTVSGKRIGKLVGLAPLAADSGNHRGKRHIRGGRSSVRAILYFITTVVERYQPDFRQFAERLRNAGKPPKVVRVALAHKLLIQLNAKARDARQSLQTA